MSKATKVCGLRLAVKLAVSIDKVVMNELVARWPVSSWNGSSVKGLAAQGPVARLILMYDRCMMLMRL